KARHGQPRTPPPALPRPPRGDRAPQPRRAELVRRQGAHVRKLRRAAPRLRGRGPVAAGAGGRAGGADRARPAAILPPAVRRPPRLAGGRPQRGRRLAGARGLHRGGVPSRGGQAPGSAAGRRALRAGRAPPPLASRRPSRYACPMSDLTAAARHFGADPEALTGLGAFESDVYRFDGPHGPAVLKVMPQGHRSASQVRGEVDWLLALVEAGVPVARPVPAQAGRWIEELDDGTVLVAFAAAPGSLTRPTDWSAARVTAWGELLGRLQAHGRAWRPAEVRRRPLLEHTYLIRAAELVPDDPGFVAAVAELMPA